MKASRLPFPTRMNRLNKIYLPTVNQGFWQPTPMLSFHWFTLPKTNMEGPKIMGIGKGTVTPFKNGNFRYLFVRFLGCIYLGAFCFATSKVTTWSSKSRLLRPGGHYQHCQELSYAHRRFLESTGVIIWRNQIWNLKMYGKGKSIYQSHQSWGSKT